MEQKNFEAEELITQNEPVPKHKEEIVLIEQEEEE